MTKLFSLLFLFLSPLAFASSAINFSNVGNLGGYQGSDWKSDSSNFTPSAAFGTVTLKSIFTRRVGDSLQIRGYWKNGTVAASLPSLALSTYTVDTTKLPPTNNIMAVGTWKRVTSGASVTYSFAAQASGHIFIDTTAPTTLQFTDGTVNNVWETTANANNWFNTSDGVWIDILIPIQGWSTASPGVTKSEVAYYGSNGLGSTNTAIERMATQVVSTGSAITFADSATLGSSFTINETGVYSIFYQSGYFGSSNVYRGISLNSTHLTTAVQTLSPANNELLCFGWSGDNTSGGCSITVNLKPGDVIRPHTNTQYNSSYNSTDPRVNFRITKVQ